MIRRSSNNSWHFLHTHTHIQIKKKKGRGGGFHARDHFHPKDPRRIEFRESLLWNGDASITESRARQITEHPVDREPWSWNRSWYRSLSGVEIVRDRERDFVYPRVIVDWSWDERTSNTRRNPAAGQFSRSWIDDAGRQNDERNGVHPCHLAPDHDCQRCDEHGTTIHYQPGTGSG